MKSLLTLSLLFFSAAAVFAFDWGGLLDNSSKIKSVDDSAGFEQSDGIYLWAESPLGGSLLLKGEGLYKFTLNAVQSETEITHILDVDLLELSGGWQLSGGFLSLYAGRFFATDITNSVFLQTCDGFSAEFTLPAVSLGAYAGYTGLLNSLNTAATMLDSDGNRLTGTGTLYELSHKYIPLSLRVSAPYLLFNSTLDMQLLGFFDLEKTDSSGAHRFYAEFTAAGPIANYVSYSLATSFGTKEFSSPMNYTSAAVTVTPLEFLAVSGGAEYASGNHLNFEGFTGFSSRTAYNSASSPELSGVLIPRLSATFAKNNMYAVLTSKVVLGVPEDSLSLTGFDESLSFRINIFSDVQLGLDVTAYFDTEDSDENYYSAALKAAITF